MNIEEIIKENQFLKEENEKLKKQLENYNNSRKAYYEKNKEAVKEKAKESLKKLSEENPDKIKEYRRNAYLKRKEKLIQNDSNESIPIEEFDNLKKSYYEKNKELVNQKAKDRLKKIGLEEPERLKEINRKAYLKRKEKLKNQNEKIIDESSILII